jgi:nitric oxide reductase subunit B
MGVYGMLAAGLAMFAGRSLIPAERWPERLAKTSFWSLNIGLAWMVFATLFPIGILQLERSVSVGYWEARDLLYLTSGYLSFIEWMRLPGDVVFIVGGVLPLLWICFLGVRHARGLGRAGAQESALFTEVTGGERGEMGGATAAGSSGERP